MVERGAMGEDEVEEDQEQQLRQRRVRDNGIVGRTGSFDSPRGDDDAMAASSTPTATPNRRHLTLQSVLELNVRTPSTIAAISTSFFPNQCPPTLQAPPTMLWYRDAAGAADTTNTTTTRVAQQQQLQQQQQQHIHESFSHSVPRRGIGSGATRAHDEGGNNWNSQQHRLAQHLLDVLQEVEEIIGEEADEDEDDWTLF